MIAPRAVLAMLAMLLGNMPVVAQEDEFLWLEERESAKALQWVNEQNVRTDVAIATRPGFEHSVEQVLAILNDDQRIPAVDVVGDRVFNFWQDGARPLGVWRRTTIGSYESGSPQWEELLDLDKLAAKEGTKWVYAGFSCLPPEFRRCLVSLSPDGGDQNEIREFDLETKAFVEGGFRVPASRSALIWEDADTLLVDAALDPADQTPSGYARLVKRWKRGEPLAAAKTVFEGGPEDVWVFAESFPDGDDQTTLIIQGIDFYDSAAYLLVDGGEARKLQVPTDTLLHHVLAGQYVFSPRSDWTGPDGAVYPGGGIYSLPLDALSKGTAKTVETLLLPKPRIAINAFDDTRISLQSRDRIFVGLLDNVRGRVMSFRREDNAWVAEMLRLPEGGNLGLSHADTYGSSVSFRYEDYLTPPSLYWSHDDGTTLRKLKSQPAQFDATSLTTEQFEAVSEDGTRIPYSVAGPKQRAAPLPTVLYGYGGFEAAEPPLYSSVAGKLWLEKGRVFVTANIRGGGEFGAAWHRAAIKENRQRAYDDFAAVARDLVERGITTPKQLGIVGRSNGGLLTGVLLTQHPELFGAVVSEVPLLDMLRYTQLPTGASWIAEYGDPAIPEERAYIERYSPYQNVKPDVAYPPALFTTSTADDRVHPGHARKMAARMLAFGHPALFHEITEGGHGGGGDQRPQAYAAALKYRFFARELAGD